MKKILNIIIAAAITCVIPACTKDFDEKNANPNAISEVTPELLLPGILKTTINRMVDESWGIGNIVVQHTAKVQFVSEDRYTWGDRSGLWNVMYNKMRDVEILYDMSEERNLPNYKAVSLILKSWMFALLTDAYGDVPYSEATMGLKEGNLTPKYDSQESIFEGIQQDLTTAINTFDDGGNSITGDLLFNGDFDKWKKLAYGLKLRYYLRVSGKKDVKADMQAIVSDMTRLFESNADNATLTYLTVAPNQFPLHTTRAGSFDEFRLSKTLGDKLLALNDTRINVFAQRAEASGNYVGVPNGLNEVDALAFAGGPNNVSKVGNFYFLDAITERGLDIAKGYIMAYPELQFILAEAVQKDLITTGQTAQWHYEEGIKASFDYYTVALPAGYLTSAGVAYNATNAAELIGTQKWIGLFFTGLEAWFDWRRTGIPAIQPGLANVNNDRIPIRFAYPRLEQTLNANSRTAAISAQGWSEDTYNEKVWSIQ